MQDLTPGQQPARPFSLELQHPGQRGAGPVELGDAEALTIVARQVNPAEREVARHVLQEVDELEARADVVARCDEPRVAVQAQQPQHEPPDRIRGVPAVLA